MFLFSVTVSLSIIHMSDLRSRKRTLEVAANSVLPLAQRTRHERTLLIGEGHFSAARGQAQRMRTQPRGLQRVPAATRSRKPSISLQTVPLVPRDEQQWGVTQTREASSGSGDSESEKEVETSRQRNLQIQRARNRRPAKALHLAEGDPTVGYLEAHAVQQRTKHNYTGHLTDLEFFAQSQRATVLLQENIEGSTKVDWILVSYFDHLFFRGRQAHTGERTMASYMDKYPSFGPLGYWNLPRAWRSLKAWKRLAPGRSRFPLAWAFWCAIAMEIVGMKEVMMAVFTLMLVEGYFRPHECLDREKMDLLPPAPGICEYWTMIIAPEHSGKTTKTGETDDSVALDGRAVQWLRPVWQKMVEGEPSDPLWNFDYPSYLKVFKAATAALKIQAVPYQARHSGPSIDRAQNLRTQAEVHKRGRWRSHRSLVRYEKHGRLQTVWNQLNPGQQAKFRDAEIHIEAAVLSALR